MISNVLIIYTGGTIGMSQGHCLAPSPMQNIIKFIPEFNKNITNPKDFTGKIAKNYASNNVKNTPPIDFIELDNGNIITLKLYSFDNPVDSADVDLSSWNAIANKIKDNYNNYDAFIVLHGTDTMAYTASALSFMLDGLAKPVILTGSQLPIYSKNSDAIANLTNAIKLAGYKSSNLDLIPEVVILFANKIIRGCRATKVHTSNFDAFDSPNCPLIGEIKNNNIIINKNILLPAIATKNLTVAKMDNSIEVIYLFPGCNLDAIIQKFYNKDTKGYIIFSYGSGNIMQCDKFFTAIGSAIKNRKSVVNLSQCNFGLMDMSLYSSGCKLLNLGVISGADLTIEAALCKLMWVIANQNKTYKPSMQKLYKGEQSLPQNNLSN